MSQPRKPYLPGVLAMISDEVGEDAAIALAKARGGRAVWIPKYPKPDSELSKIVGHQNALKISDLCGMGNIMVPCGNFGGMAGRRARAKELLQTGMSHSDIAARLDVTTRTVERVAAELKAESAAPSKQPRLI